MSLLHGLLVLAVVLQLDQIHLRFSCPPFNSAPNLKLNVSGMENSDVCPSV